MFWAQKCHFRRPLVNMVLCTGTKVFLASAHACLEHEYDFAYFESLFIPLPMLVDKCYHCSCSKIAILWTIFSPSSKSFCSRTASTLSLSRIWTCRLETWHLIGMTTASLNSSLTGVDWILVLKLVQYAHRVLWSFVFHSVQFSLTIFFRIFCKVLFVDSASPFT